MDGHTWSNTTGGQRVDGDTDTWSNASATTTAKAEIGPPSFAVDARHAVVSGNSVTDSSEPTGWLLADENKTADNVNITSEMNTTGRLLLVGENNTSENVTTDRLPPVSENTSPDASVDGLLLTGENKTPANTTGLLLAGENKTTENTTGLPLGGEETSSNATDDHLLVLVHSDTSLLDSTVDLARSDKGSATSTATKATALPEMNQDTSSLNTTSKSITFFASEIVVAETVSRSNVTSAAILALDDEDARRKKFAKPEKIGKNAPSPANATSATTAIGKSATSSANTTTSTTAAALHVEGGGGSSPHHNATAVLAVDEGANPNHNTAAPALPVVVVVDGGSDTTTATGGDGVEVFDRGTSSTSPTEQSPSTAVDKQGSSTTSTTTALHLSITEDDSTLLSSTTNITTIRTSSFVDLREEVIHQKKAATSAGGKTGLSGGMDFLGLRRLIEKIVPPQGEGAASQSRPPSSTPSDDEVASGILAALSAWSSLSEQTKLWLVPACAELVLVY
ncbi:unnamed protein product [Amoebophrya sp. A25]|nr:unnamed protein product [Amoebophrya sp. A25]|eukprot:GSA25T00022258001.1